MPYSYSDAEFALFTKTERRMLRMIYDLKMGREQICKALEIVDSTFRMHKASIQRKQARMRLARANAATAQEQKRISERFLPEPDFSFSEPMETPTIVPQGLTPMKGRLPPSQQPVRKPASTGAFPGFGRTVPADGHNHADAPGADE